MSLLRILIRALFFRPRRKARYQHTSAPIAAFGLSDVRLIQQVSCGDLASVAVQVHAELSGSCWVIDGDTIDIGGKRIRLAGIDAPEMEHPFGHNAKFALIELCKGKKITARFDGADHYQRNIATCFLPDGSDLSAEMVKAGLAIDWPKYSGGKYRAFEVAGVRQKLWRCVARQQGRMPPLKAGQD